DGADHAEFTVTGVSDWLNDGTQTASVVVSADGFERGTADLQVTDTDSPTLAIEVSSATVREDASVDVTVIRNTGGSGATVVTLSGDTTELNLPSTVTIPNNSDRITFTVPEIVDGMVDGNRNVTITAAADGFTAAHADVNVMDTDSPALSLDIEAAAISENGGAATVTVTRNTVTTASLTVALAVSDSIVSVPA
ncbi:MAG: hypothetical protein KDA89_19160, partial [Planctomycetaceae bacterium]|nr:hypothetical protein [Planctomycetaceae bacterium]